MNQLDNLDVIANLKPVARDRLQLVEPAYQAIKFLPVGQVGTVVEVYEGERLQYLVEFADSQGREYALAVLRPDEILVLHYEPSLA